MHSVLLLASPCAFMATQHIHCGSTYSNHSEKLHSLLPWNISISPWALYERLWSGFLAILWHHLNSLISRKILKSGKVPLANTMWLVHCYEMHWHACMETPLLHSLTLSHHLLSNISPEIITWLFGDTHVRTMVCDTPCVCFSPRKGYQAFFLTLFRKGLDTLLKSKNRIKGVSTDHCSYVCGGLTLTLRNGWISKLTSIFHASILLLIMNFIIKLSK